MSLCGLNESVLSTSLILAAMRMHPADSVIMIASIRHISSPVDLLTCWHERLGGLSLIHSFETAEMSYIQQSLGGQGTQPLSYTISPLAAAALFPKHLLSIKGLWLLPYQTSPVLVVAGALERRTRRVAFRRVVRQATLRLSAPNLQLRPRPVNDAVIFIYGMESPRHYFI